LDESQFLQSATGLGNGWWDAPGHCVENAATGQFLTRVGTILQGKGRKSACRLFGAGAEGVSAFDTFGFSLIDRRVHHRALSIEQMGLALFRSNSRFFESFGKEVFLHLFRLQGCFVIPFDPH
jgi:hypothetical protein